MTNEQAQQTANGIFKDIFGVDNPLLLEQMRSLLTEGIPLPVATKCALSGKDIFVYDPQPQHQIISEEAYLAQMKVDGWMKETTPMSSIDDVLGAFKSVAYMTAEKAPNSQQIAQSDSITASSSVFGSALIGNSKQIIFSQNNFFSNYLLACRGNSSCNFGIRTFDSLYCSSSFEVRWSNKVAKSFFINDASDLFECMFCYGIRSKKYCIANRQYSQEDYMKVKALVVEWILKTYIPARCHFA